MTSRGHEGCPIGDHRHKVHDFTGLLEQYGDPNKGILVVKKHGCPHCEETTQLLESLSYVNPNKIKYIDLLEPRNRDLYEDFSENGWKVPQIFIGNLHIVSGNSGLKELYTTDKLEDIIKRTNSYLQDQENIEAVDQIPQLIGMPDDSIFIILQGDVLKDRNTMCRYCVKMIDLLSSLPYLNTDKVGIVNIDEEDPRLRMFMYKHNLGIPLIYVNNKYYEEGFDGFEKMKNCGELESFIREIGAHKEGIM